VYCTTTTTLTESSRADPGRTLQTLLDGAHAPDAWLNNFDEVRRNGLSLQASDPRIVPKRILAPSPSEWIEALKIEAVSGCVCLLEPEPPGPQRGIQFPEIVETEPSEVHGLADRVPGHSHADQVYRP
jgi:hypothetical protein